MPRLKQVSMQSQQLITNQDTKVTWINFFDIVYNNGENMAYSHTKPKQTSILPLLHEYILV